MYMTTSVTFFPPQSALRPLEALLKKPGAVTDVRSCILFTPVAFFRARRTYLVGVRWSVDSSSVCVWHTSAISGTRYGPGVRDLRWAQVTHRIVKLCVRSVDVESPALVMTSVPSQWSIHVFYSTSIWMMPCSVVLGHG
jgi:hypothetical protein